MIQIMTDRLLLREIREADGDVLWQYTQEPAFQTYEDEPPSSAQGFADITKWMIAEQTRTPRIHHYLAMTLHGQPDHILGSIYVSIHDRTHRQAETGYMLGVPYWGCGYTTEALIAILPLAFKQLAVHRLYAEVIIENTGSVRVLEKAGFQREAHLRETKFFRGRWWDQYIYALRAATWRDRVGQD